MDCFARKSVRPFRETRLLKRRFNKFVPLIPADFCAAEALRNAGQTKLPEKTACKAAKKWVESQSVSKPKGD